MKTWLLAFCFSVLGPLASEAAEPRILIVVGPSTHPPGSHEVAAGGRLLRYCLEHSDDLPGISAEVVQRWPADEAALENVGSVVFIGDTFPPQRMPDTQKILQQLERMMARGCGIACVHYATGLLGEDVNEDGDHPLLHWLGGYFANRSCPHHQSIAKIFPAATISPTSKAHPIHRGWQEFTVHDEPYINNYFGKQKNQPAANVTILATSLLPPDNPQPESVAWCVERADGGRGFGIVMPHFYKNWSDDDLRCFILNGIAWTAKVEIPDSGVRSSLPDLQAFAPAAVEPR